MDVNYVTYYLVLVQVQYVVVKPRKKNKLLLKESMEENGLEVKNILAIGGMDPTGGAGVLTDVRAAKAAAVHAAVTVTTMTVQSNERFFSSHVQDPDVVRETLKTVLGAMSIGAVKTGALGSADIASVLAEFASEPSFPPMIVDPVILSTSGGTLLSSDGVDILKDALLPATTLLTPNLAEAAQLTGLDVKTVNDMKRAAVRLLEMGPRAVLVKGGHLNGESDTVVDVYANKNGTNQIFESRRLGQSDVRGTGCALASLIAAFVAKGSNLIDAITEAKKLLASAIASAIQIAPGPKFLNF